MCTGSRRGRGQNKRPLMTLANSQQGSVQSAGARIPQPHQVWERRTEFSWAVPALSAQVHAQGEELLDINLRDISNIPQNPVGPPEKRETSRHPGMNMGVAREKRHLLKRTRFLCQPKWLPLPTTSRFRGNCKQQIIPSASVPGKKSHRPTHKPPALFHVC